MFTDELVARPFFAIKLTLVITIIVMLVLAGVSINALVGENGVITQAQRAKQLSDKAVILENLDTELASYNMDIITDGDTTEVSTMLSKLINKGVLDNVMTSNGSFTTDMTQLATVPIMNEDGSWAGKFKYIVGKGQYTFSIFQNEDGTFTSEESDIIAGEEATGGEVTGGTTLVTKDTFTAGDSEEDDDNKKGQYTINGNANVIFTDRLSGSYSIYVKSGANATVSIFKDMTLSNNGLKRSAIDIEPGGTLNLWIADGAVVTVDSGLGTAGEVGSELGAQGGPGGFAGIHVPKYEVATDVIIGYEDRIPIKRHFVVGTATLNLAGEGTLIAYGGNAGKGTDSAGKYGGGGGRRSRCWNWG